MSSSSRSRHSKLLPILLATAAAAAAAGVVSPAQAQCGGEHEWPCVCWGILRIGLLRIPYPRPCCDGGYGIDTNAGLRCSACSLVGPSYLCTGDGRGGEGEDPWAPFSAESLRAGGRLFDTGLILGSNLTRHRGDVDDFAGSVVTGRGGGRYPTGGEWGWRAFRLQEQLEGRMPLTQAFFPGTHNSFNTFADHYQFYQHTYSMSDQLDMGVRKLNLDIHLLPRSVDPFQEIRLSHANNDHLGGSGGDRPLRHGLEEIARWVRANPDAVVIIEFENRAYSDPNDPGWLNVIIPIEQLFGAASGTDIIFRPSDRVALGGSWNQVTREGMLGLGTPGNGKRVLFCVWHSASGEPIPEAYNLGHVLPSPQEWQGDGENNSVNEFMRHHQFSGWTRTGGQQLGQFDAFEASTQSVWPINDFFGQTNPENVTAMVRAGVNFVGMEPIGQSVAGVPHYDQPFEPLMRACVWSWAPNEPSDSDTPRAAAVIRNANRDGDETDEGDGRMYAVTPGELHRYAMLNETGTRWTFSPTAVTFQAARQATPSGPWRFMCPGNGLQLELLLLDMAAAGIPPTERVWVNYQNIDSAKWTAAVLGQRASMYVATNGSEANGGTDPDHPLPSILSALIRTSPTDQVVINVGPGEYFERFSTFDLQNRVITIQGSRNGPTIINGGNGGTVFDATNGTTLQLSDLSITGSDGPAIRVDSPSASVELDRCAVYGNVALHYAAGVAMFDGALTLTNCTFAGNTCRNGSAIAAFDGLLRISSCTVAGNTNLHPLLETAGILVGFGTFGEMSNTIVAGNTGGLSPDMAVQRVQQMTSHGYNLIGNRATWNFSWQNAPGDLFNVDPLLGTLALHGGTTPTRVPALGSPAREAGDPALALTIDQRGLRRSERSNCAAPWRSDIGAVEVEYMRFPNTVYVSPAGNDAWTGEHPDSQAPDGPKATIQAAIDAGCDTDHAASISVLPGTYHERINTHGRLIDISAIGGPDVTTIDGTGLFGSVVTYAAGEQNVRLNGFTITGGSGPAGGGVFVGEARPIITNCVITGNAAAAGGGACVAAPTPFGAARFFNCTFRKNISSGGGGVCSQSGGGMILSNCLISENQTLGPGGGARAIGANFVFYNCTIAGNRSVQNGGGIHHSADCYLHNTIVWSNTGGAEISSSGGTFHADSSTFPDAPNSDGNLRGDPSFLDPLRGNYRLGPLSACVDAGGPADISNVPATDLDGRPRAVNITCWGSEALDANGRAPIDMGCFEVWNASDWDGNGVQDFCDIALAGTRDCNRNGILDTCEGNPWPQVLVEDFTGLGMNWVGRPDARAAGMHSETITFDLGSGRIVSSGLPGGFDFRIHQPEPGDNANWALLTDVLVSEDGATFASIKGTEAYLAPDQRAFSLSGSPVGGRAARYIRLVSTATATSPDGFRLDAVTVEPVSYLIGDPFGGRIVRNDTTRPNGEYEGVPVGAAQGHLTLTGDARLIYDVGAGGLVDGEGADLTIYTTMLEGVAPWTSLRVEVSDDGVAYYDISTSATTAIRVRGDSAAIAAGVGARSYDLAAQCRPSARFVRLSSANPGLPTVFQVSVDALGLANTAASPCDAESRADCNGNGRSDACDIAEGLVDDCNHNGRPDQCEAPGGFALQFNGTSSQAVIAHTPLLNTNRLTVEAWINPARTDGSRGIINKYEAGSYSGYNLFLLNGHLRGWYFVDFDNCVWDGSVGMDGGEIEPGVWTHVAMTIDDNGGRLYVNGELVTAMAWRGTPAPTTTTIPLSIGRYPAAEPYGNPWFEGLIDEVRIWDVARTHGQVASRMSLPLSLGNLDTEGRLLALHHFDTGTGDVAFSTNQSPPRNAALTDTSWATPITCCRADFNRDDAVDSSDFFAYLAAFFAGEPEGGADFDGSGAIDSSDFFVFLAAFLAGC